MEQLQQLNQKLLMDNDKLLKELGTLKQNTSNVEKDSTLKKIRDEFTFRLLAGLSASIYVIVLVSTLFATLAFIEGDHPIIAFLCFVLFMSALMPILS